MIFPRQEQHWRYQKLRLLTLKKVGLIVLEKIEDAGDYLFVREETNTRYDLNIGNIGTQAPSFEIFVSDYLSKLDTNGQKVVSDYICQIMDGFENICSANPTEIINTYIDQYSIDYGSAVAFKLQVVPSVNTFSTDSELINTMVLEVPTLTLTPGQKQNSLSWNQVAGANGYGIVWATNSNFSPSYAINIGNVATTVHSGLTAPTYYYKIQAKKDNYKSPFSNTKVGSPVYTSGVSGKIYYDFDGNGGYNLGSGDKYVQYAVVSLYQKEGADDGKGTFLQSRRL